MPSSDEVPELELLLLSPSPISVRLCGTCLPNSTGRLAPTGQEELIQLESAGRLRGMCCAAARLV